MDSTVMHITVDQEKFDIKVEGNDRQLVALLGGVEYAKQWLVRQLMIRSGDTAAMAPEAPHCVKTDPAYTADRRVSKEEATSAYLEAWKTFEQRLQEISHADDRATFLLPEYLSDTSKL